MRALAARNAASPRSGSLFCWLIWLLAVEGVPQLREYSSGASRKRVPSSWTEVQPGDLTLHGVPRTRSRGMTQRLRGSTAATAAGALAVAIVLAVVLAGHRDDFAQALR